MVCEGKSYGLQRRKLWFSEAKPMVCGMIYGGVHLAVSSTQKRRGRVKTGERHALFAKENMKRKEGVSRQEKDTPSSQKKI